MAGHEIDKITGRASFTVLWDGDEPAPGQPIYVSEHLYHCVCGEVFDDSESAAEHVEKNS